MRMIIKYCVRKVSATRLPAAFLFVFCFCLITNTRGQQSVVIYQDRQLPEDAKSAIREMASLLSRSPGVTARIDSVNDFSGRGIYFTFVNSDRYKKAPASIRQMGEEAIYINASAGSVYSVANSSLAVTNAVHTYLGRLGFRFYFPDPAWHIIPANPKLFEPFTILDEPDFAFRSIFMGWGYGSDQLRSRYNFWERANRMGGHLQVRAEHSYLKMLAAKRTEFEKNPDYLTRPLLNGQKQSKTAFNFASPGLASLAHQWLSETFEKDKKAGKNTPMLSLEAFDGPNYCDLPGCKKLGDNSSDQFFYFTNQVAKKLKKSHPGKWIGVLAYNDHIDIPKYPVEDNIFVTLTSAFNPSGYSTDQLIQRWKTKVKRMGMYDYIGLYTSTYELPGRGLAGNYNNQAIILKKYHQQNIVSYQAESTYGWIPKGISQYLVSQLAWDATQPVEPIIDQFFRDCFPNTEKIIRPVFDSWAQPFILTENDIHKWLTAVQRAFGATKDAAELERIHQLALYLRYVTLFKAYDDVKSDAAKSRTAAADLMAYMNAVLETGVVASYAGINTLASTLGKDFAYSNKSAIWKSRSVTVPRTPADWNKWFVKYLPGLQRMEEVASYEKAPFVSSTELADISRKFTVQNKTQEVSFNGSMIVIADTKQSDSLFINIRGGRIKKAGHVSVTVYPWNNEMKPEGQKLLTARFSANGKYNKVSLAGLERGRYVIHVADSNSSGAHAYFPRKLKYSIVASPQYPIRYAFYNNYYIYVPRDTRVFYITKTHYLQLFDPSGKRSAYATQESKLVEVKVGKGMHGWWRVQMQLRDIYFTGIPPLLSRDPESFFLPD